MNATQQQHTLSPQGRLLQKAVVGRLLRHIIVCCVIVIAAVFLLDRLASGPIATYLADTAEWHVFQPESAEEERELQILLESKPMAVWDIQTNPIDHTIWVRDLTLYHFVKVSWLPAILCILFAAILFLTLAAFRRMYALVDALTGAVADLVADEEKPVDLPSELSIAHEELERIRKESLARRIAAETNRKQSQELMAYLVHDVRTPLTTVIGNLSLLQECSDLDPEAHEEIAVALRRAEEMETLTSDLFDITRIALDPTSVSLKPIDLRLLTLQMADELYDGTFCTTRKHPAKVRAEHALSKDDTSTLTPLKKTTQKNLHSQATHNTPVLILGDPYLLAKAMEHLFQSALALKGASDAIEIRGGIANHTALVVVRAPLTGYPKNYAQTLIEHAFEPFFRHGSSNGVSLAFTREIARAHGGDALVWTRGDTIELVLALPVYNDSTNFL